MKKKQQTPSEVFRPQAKVYSRCEDDRLETFQAKYKALKNKIIENEIQNYEMYQFIHAAIGMLTYGDLTAVRDQIQYMPEFTGISGHDEGYISRLMPASLLALLPVPRELSRGRDIRSQGRRAEFLQWFEENQSKLLWNEEAGKFEFKPGEGPPPEPPPPKMSPGQGIRETCLLWTVENEMLPLDLQLTFMRANYPKSLLWNRQQKQFEFDSNYVPAPLPKASTFTEEVRDSYAKDVYADFPNQKAYFETMYPDFQEQVLSNPTTDYTSERNKFIFAGIGLLACGVMGHLNELFDVLLKLESGYPWEERNFEYLIRLFPVPDELSDVDDLLENSRKEELRNWLLANQNQFVWDYDEDQYVWQV